MCLLFYREGEILPGKEEMMKNRYDILEEWKGVYMEKTVILFDLDGTLTDPKVGITKSVAYALEQEGIHVADIDSLCPFIGPPLKESFMKLYNFDEVQAERAIQNYRVYFVKQGMFENEVYPGIEGMLNALRAHGKTLLIATSKPTVYAKQIVAHFHLEEYFLEVCGSELNGERSKKAEVIDYALQQHSFQPADCVMIGDRLHDIIGAKSNGMESIGVLYGYGDMQELQHAGADELAHDVEELQKLLLGV